MRNKIVLSEKSRPVLANCKAAAKTFVIPYLLNGKMVNLFKKNPRIFNRKFYSIQLKNVSIAVVKFKGKPVKRSFPLYHLINEILHDDGYIDLVLKLGNKRLAREK